MDRICTYKRFSDNNIGQVGGDTNRCLTKSGMTSRSIDLKYVQNASNYADNQLLPIKNIGSFEYWRVSINFDCVNDVYYGDQDYGRLFDRSLRPSLEIYDSYSKELISTCTTSTYDSRGQYYDITWYPENVADIYPQSALKLVPKLFNSTGTPITIYSSAQNPVPITYDDIPTGYRHNTYYFGNVNVPIIATGDVNFSSTSKVLFEVRLTVTNKITSYTSESDVGTTSSNYIYGVGIGNMVQVYDGTTLTLQFLDKNGSILSVNGGQTSYQKSFTGKPTDEYGYIFMPDLNLD